MLKKTCIRSYTSIVSDCCTCTCAYNKWVLAVRTPTSSGRVHGWLSFPSSQHSTDLPVNGSMLCIGRLVNSLMNTPTLPLWPIQYYSRSDTHLPQSGAYIVVRYQGDKALLLLTEGDDKMLKVCSVGTNLHRTDPSLRDTHERCTRRHVWTIEVFQTFTPLDSFPTTVKFKEHSTSK